MRIETLLREAMTEWSEQAGPVTEPGELARRALRRRTRQRMGRALLATAAAGLLVITGAVVVHGDEQGGADKKNTVVSPGGSPDKYWGSRLSTGTGVRADPKSSPPRRLVAAGDLVLSAYYMLGREKDRGDGVSVIRRTWFLYDHASRKYRQTPWAYVDVAPGMARAAVLERTLPSRRVGLLDMTTGKVDRWIPLHGKGGGLAWSPDGRRLLVTTYRENPDRIGSDGMNGIVPTPTRTGYELIDMQDMKPVFRAFPADEERNSNVRQDFGWSQNGKLIFSPTDTDPSKVFYDLNGRPHAAPAHEADAMQDAAVSPDGKHFAGDAGIRPGPATAVFDAATGAKVGVQQMEQLVAWADNDHLIAIACEPLDCSGKGEFHNRFVLVSIDGKQIVPLTGVRQNSQGEHSWVPLFTAR